MGRTCSLCGGKLDRDDICRECGLDNSKCDANYEKTMQKPKGKRVEKKAAIIAVICAFAGQALSVIPGIIQDIVSDADLDKIESIFEDSDDSEYDYDKYQYVTREIPTEGEAYNVFLGRGEYIVGVHIPEGIYACNAGGEYAAIGVEDVENSIWLYEWVDEDQSEVTDIRLYRGAVVEIYGETMMELTTENAQMGDMMSEENPLPQESVTIDKSAVVGIDIPAGVYDVKIDAGYGSFDIEIYDNGEVIEQKYLWLDADDEVENIYKNLVLPENAKITWDEEETIRLVLTPSQHIKDTDYTGYYKR